MSKRSIREQLSGWPGCFRTVPHKNPVRRRAELKASLDHLVDTFDISTLTPDPLELVLRYSDPLDQEIAGIVAAAFAYGRADTVVRNCGRLLNSMGPSPFGYLRDRFSIDEAAVRFEGFSHRFHKTADVVALFEKLAFVIRRQGSLGALFRSVYRHSDADIGPSLSRFVEAILSAPGTDSRHAPALRYLLSNPKDGSACKRMNLFLRWMVRRSLPDLGLWDFVDPGKLIMPLDTHIHRITTFLGLNRRKSADWKTAAELTQRLKKLAPEDPVRYDFALCRLGILALCSRRRDRACCEVCLLRDVCRFPVH